MKLSRKKLQYMSYTTWSVDKCLPLILIANFVLPGSEAPSGRNIFALEIRERLG
jgi:hypothetical protein